MKIPKRQPETKAEKIAAWRENIPEKYRGTYDKAMAGNSLRKAIDAKCQECQNWQVAEIPICENVVCPLHPYRPQKGRSARDNPRRGRQNKITRSKGSPIGVHSK
jgi:hypothetical protein